MYYFVSDTHLGMDATTTSLEREKLLVRWLEEVSKDAKAIFMVGDIFDFWFEWRRVIPKGYTRLLGKLSELCDRGVKIHFFVGNHDMWAYDYLETECGVELHKGPKEYTLNGKQLYIAHGDNMCFTKRPFAENVMHKIFRSNTMRKLFARFIHPNSAMRFGSWWSHKSRKSHPEYHKFGGDKEPLIQFARNYQENIAKQHIDYFIFGHIHCAKVFPLGKGDYAIFLGEWLNQPTYCVLNREGEMELKKVKL